MLPKISEGVCPFRHGLHGHWLLKAKKKLGYIALAEDFTEFGLASKIFRRGVSVSARTSRTLPFDAKKKWAISLSSRSLVLLPQFLEGVCPFRHGLHGHCLLTPKKKMGYIALGEDFTEFGLASTIFRRGVSVSAWTSRTLAFEEPPPKKKVVYRSL